MAAPSSGFAFYRLRSGRYAGLRIRDVWRDDPTALLTAARSATTDPNDTRMIGLFLVLIGAVNLLGRPQQPHHKVDQQLAQRETFRTTSATARARVTALPREIGVQARLDETLRTAMECRESVAIICFVLDDIATLQARVGRAEAGYILGVVAARLIGKVGEQGTVGWLGETRLVTLVRLALGHMPPTAIRRAAMVYAEMLRDAITVPVATKRHRVDVTIHIGLAVAPADGTDAQELLALASTNVTHDTPRGTDRALSR